MSSEPVGHRKPLLTARLLGLLAVLLAVAVLAFVDERWSREGAARLADFLPAQFPGGQTVAERLEQYGQAARSRLSPDFARVEISYPPSRILLVGVKLERQLEVWVAGPDGPLKHLRTYPILGMSGRLGPKLREGDRQAPEGFYRIESLNPNSRFHLSLRIDYPNEEDLSHARAEGRTQPGSDIMIHGGRASIGCLAMGDQAAEDLFVLVAETGLKNTAIILSPVDFRVRDLPADMPEVPPWTGELYDALRLKLRSLPE